MHSNSNKYWQLISRKWTMNTVSNRKIFLFSVFIWFLCNRCGLWGIVKLYCRNTWKKRHSNQLKWTMKEKLTFSFNVIAFRSSLFICSVLSGHLQDSMDLFATQVYICCFASIFTAVKMKLKWNYNNSKTFWKQTRGKSERERIERKEKTRKRCIFTRIAVSHRITF